MRKGGRKMKDEGWKDERYQKCQHAINLSAGADFWCIA